MIIHLTGRQADCPIVETPSVPWDLRQRASRPCWVRHGKHWETKDSLPYKDLPTLKLAAKRSTNFLQIQFRFNSDSIQI
ncbi:hypothetical protein ACN38_g12857, partial [Penicillium nordicum]